MADPSSPDAGVGSDRGPTTSTPRWVKVFGIIVLALVLLLAIAMLTGLGGRHGPGRHAHSGDTAPSSVTALSSVTESGGVGVHIPSTGGHTL